MWCDCMERGKRTLVNVWQNTTLCDCDVTEQLVQFLIVSNGELKVTWDDTSLLVVTSGVAGKFEDFGSEVLKDSCEVHRGTWYMSVSMRYIQTLIPHTSTDTLSVVALSQ